MLIYVGFDDTDTSDSDRGTGKLARWFEDELPKTCRLWGVVRQQLLLDDAIPYTTHNSSACAVIETSDSITVEDLIPLAIHHIERHFIPGSDPGLCLVSEDHPELPRLISFGQACTKKIVTQKETLQAASGVHISGHGGTNDGIIGAAAAVGLTAHGWGGRFIEFGRLRDFGEEVYVSEIERAGIRVVSIDREAQIPTPEDLVRTGGWLRPRLWGGRPILPVTPIGRNLWEAMGEKNRRKKN
jgi:tRNA(Ile2) C34 agmatinyltransferase TiaS